MLEERDVAWNVVFCRGRGVDVNLVVLLVGVDDPAISALLLDARMVGGFPCSLKTITSLLCQ